MIRKEKGITLIALVVTIVVLLILAGVSISLVLGNNGIISKAKEAKKQTEIAEIIDRAKLEITETWLYKNNNENITDEEAKAIIAKYDKNYTETNKDTIKTNEEGKEYITSKNGYEILVSDIWNGIYEEENPVFPNFDVNEFTLGTDKSYAQNNDKYGWKVPEYTVKTPEMSTNIWRLFYQDNNYTYLITDECLGPVALREPCDPVSGHQTTSEGLQLLKRLNPSLLDWSQNFPAQKACAWLTDPDTWSSYANEDVSFAIRFSDFGTFCCFI